MTGRRRLFAAIRSARRTGVAICLLLLIAWAASTIVNYRSTRPDGTFYFGRGRIIGTWGWPPNPYVNGLPTGWHFEDVPWDAVTLVGHVGLNAPVSLSGVFELLWHDTARTPGNHCVLLPLWMPLTVAAYFSAMLWWAGRAPGSSALAAAGAGWRRAARRVGLLLVLSIVTMSVISHFAKTAINGGNHRLLLASGGLGLVPLERRSMTEVLGMTEAELFRHPRRQQLMAAYCAMSASETYRRIGEEMPAFEVEARWALNGPIWFTFRMDTSTSPPLYWVIVPLWPIVLLLVPPTIAAYVRRLHPTYDACPHCGYNLTGNVSGVCPECGTACRPAAPPAASPPIQ